MLTGTSSPLPPSNGVAADLAGERNDDAVAALDLCPFGLERIRPVLLGDLADRLVDLGVGDLGGELFEAEALEVRQIDLGQDLEFKLYRQGPTCRR